NSTTQVGDRGNPCGSGHGWILPAFARTRLIPAPAISHRRTPEALRAGGPDAWMRNAQAQCSIRRSKWGIGLLALALCLSSAIALRCSRTAEDARSAPRTP